MKTRSRARRWLGRDCRPIASAFQLSTTIPPAGIFPISAPPTGPTAELRVSSESATTDEYTVSLIDESSAGDTPIREWRWEYGAGTSTEQYPTVSLPRGSMGQTYLITLEVTDANGFTDFATSSFTVPPRDEEGLVPAPA